VPVRAPAFEGRPSSAHLPSRAACGDWAGGTAYGPLAGGTVEVVVLAQVHAACLQGVDGRPVAVEVHVSNGLPGFTVVGLPDAAVREARDRVRAALLSCGLRWPQRRVTVNLAPSGERKAGPGLDLPIALGLLAAQGELPSGCLDGLGCFGELGLDGSVRPVPGTVPLLRALQTPVVVIPRGAWPDATMLATQRVRPVASLAEVVEVLRGKRGWPPPPAARPAPTADPLPDLADVRGQRLGRRALEVAAAGGHHLLLVGPPGCGKTMLANRLPGLLPPLSDPVAAQVAAVWSAAGLPLANLLARRPAFRAPHHSITPAGLVGGGPWSRPGEASLAHGGVLFLDELAEMAAGALDALREPLEEGVVRLARAHGMTVLPARFQLVAATNPCPCGEGTVRGACRCSEAGRARYLRRLSCALLDRFDLVVVLARPDAEALVAGAAAGGGGTRGSPCESSATVAARVAAARARAAERGSGGHAAMTVGAPDHGAALPSAAAAVLVDHLRSGRLSGRGAQRVRRVARTVADLAGAETIEECHVAEALALHAGRSVLLGRSAVGSAAQ